MSCCNVLSVRAVVPSPSRRVGRLVLVRTCTNVYVLASRSPRRGPHQGPLAPRRQPATSILLLNTGTIVQRHRHMKGTVRNVDLHYRKNDYVTLKRNQMQPYR